MQRFFAVSESKESLLYQIRKIKFVLMLLMIVLMSNLSNVLPFFCPFLVQKNQHVQFYLGVASVKLKLKKEQNRYACVYICIYVYVYVSVCSLST